VSIFNAMRTPVECLSSQTYAERPVALTWNDQRLEITEIKTRWRTPEGWGFQVCTADGQIFEVFYGESKDEWRIQQP
jgi:hypothetical protein